MKEKTWLTSGKKGCLFSLKKILMMTMGKTFFYMEFLSSLLKLWKMKNMVTTRWGEVKICWEREGVGHEHMFLNYFAPSLMYIVRNFLGVDIGWSQTFYENFANHLWLWFFYLANTRLHKKVWVVLNQKMHKYISHKVYQHQPCPIMSITLILTPT